MLLRTRSTVTAVSLGGLVSIAVLCVHDAIVVVVVAAGGIINVSSHMTSLVVVMVAMLFQGHLGKLGTMTHNDDDDQQRNADNVEQAKQCRRNVDTAHFR